MRIRLMVMMIISVFPFISVPSPTRADLVPLQNATASYSTTFPEAFLVSQAIDGDLSPYKGWSILYPDSGATFRQTAVFETVSDIGSTAETYLTFTFYQSYRLAGNSLGRFRLSATTDARSEFANGLHTGGDVSADWTVLQPLSASAIGGTTLNILGDKSVLASGPNPQTNVYTVTARTSLLGITGFRLEVLDDLSLPYEGPGRYPGNGNFVLTEFQVSAQGIPENSGFVLTALGAAVAAGAPTKRLITNRM